MQLRISITGTGADKTKQGFECEIGVRAVREEETSCQQPAVSGKIRRGVGMMQCHAGCFSIRDSSVREVMRGSICKGSQHDPRL